MADTVSLIKWGQAGDKKGVCFGKTRGCNLARWLLIFLPNVLVITAPRTAGGLSRKPLRILRCRLLQVRSFKQLASLTYSSLIIHLMTGWMIPICRERSPFRWQSPSESEGSLRILCVVIITAHSRVAPRTHNLLSGVTLHSPQL